MEKKKVFFKAPRYWVLFCFLMFCNVLMAENSEVLMIDFVDGNSVQIELPDAPLISFREATMVVQSNKVTAEYEQGKVAGFRFVPVPTQIKEILKTNSVYIQYGIEEKLKVIGANGMAIKIFKVDGSNVVSQNVASDEFSLSLCNLVEGIYILKLSNGLQFKFYKK